MADAAAAKGFAAITVNDIVQEARVSRHTFYEHFPSGKEECFVAAFDEALGYLLAAIREAVERETTAPARLRAGLTAVVELLAAEPALARLFVVEVFSAGPEAIQRRDAAMNAFVAMLGAGVWRAMPGESLSPILVETVLASIYGVTYRRVEAGQPDQLHEALPHLVYAALLPIAGEEAALEQMRIAEERVSR